MGMVSKVLLINWQHNFSNRFIWTSVNPNSSWLNGKGFWLSYTLGVLLLHLVLLCIPVLTTAQAWTLTNVIHNMVMLLPPKQQSFPRVRQSIFLKFCSACWCSCTYWKERRSSHKIRGRPVLWHIGNRLITASDLPLLVNSWRSSPSCCKWFWLSLLLRRYLFGGRLCCDWQRQWSRRNVGRDSWSRLLEL